MEVTVGITELLGAVISVIAAGWALLNISFDQFEKRLDGKFEGQSERIQRLELLTLDVKRLEVEIVKRDSLYVPRSELQATFDKMFNILREIQTSLDKKVDRDDCDKRHGQ